MTNPFPFDLLLSRASKRWERYSEILVAALRAVQVRTPADGSLQVVRYDRDGALLTLDRPIPRYQKAKAGSGGIPAADPTTGEWGSAEVTLYDDLIDDTDPPRSVLGTRTQTAWNDDPDVVVPANSRVYLIEQGGYLMVLGYPCPPPAALAARRSARPS